MIPQYIIDTSALIAYLSDERESGEVIKFLPACQIPFICLSELYYLIWNKKDRAEADKIYAVVKSWKLPVLYPNEEVILNAGRIKAIYKLGIADSYIASFTLSQGLALMTKDRDYELLKDEIKIFMLK